MTDADDQTALGDFTAVGIVQHRFVREVSFPIRRGGVAYLFGINNAGKSTMLDAVRLLGGRVPCDESWVIAYAEPGEIGLTRDEADRQTEWWRDCIAEIEASRSTWFSLDDDVNPYADEPEGWATFRHQSTRDPRDAELGAPTRVAITNAFAGGKPGVTTSTAWWAIEPHPLSTATTLDFDYRKLMYGVPGSELHDVGHGGETIGPRAALGAMPEPLYRALEEWSDDVYLDELTDWDDRPDGPPTEPPPAATDVRAIPVSWYLNPSRLIPTLSTFITPLKSPIAVITPDSGIESTANWQTYNVDFLERIITLVSRAWFEQDEFNPPIRDRYFYLRGRRRRAHPATAVVLEQLAKRATSFIPDFARHSPASRFEFVADPDAGEVLARIKTTIHGAETSLAIDELAEGLRMWHRLAISAALSFHSWMSVIDTLFGEAQHETPFVALSDGPVFIVIDEPERHLHPAAQRAAAQWLRQFAEQTGAYVIAATHSPAFLTADDSLHLHVDRRMDDSVVVTEIDHEDLVAHFRDNETFGANQGEALAAYDSYLVVEGEHERIILEEWCRPEIVRCLICPMRGTTRAKSATLQVEAMLRIAPKPVGVLVDWDSVGARIADLASDIESAEPGEARLGVIEREVPNFNRKRHENWIYLLVFGHARGRTPIRMLAEPDVVFLLDEHLVGEGSGRPYTHAEGRRVVESKARGSKPIKEFLEEHFELRQGVFSDEAIRAMAVASQGPGRTVLRHKIASLLEDLAQPSSAKPVE